MFGWDTGGMYTLELYARVRRAVHVEGRSQREVAQKFELARKTVRKMSAYSAPPGYERQKRCGGRSWVRGEVHRRHSGRRREPAAQAASHREADLRAVAREARVHRRLHDCEGLRAPGEDRLLWEMFTPLQHAQAKLRPTSVKL